MATSTRGASLLRAEPIAKPESGRSTKRSTASRRVRAREAWTAIVQAVMARRDYLSSEAAKLDLTLPQVLVLKQLAMGPARTMTSIADALACDASNVTGLVDKLEARGLIERKSSSDDRRTKPISITRTGSSIIAALKQKMFEPPDGFGRLSDDDIAALHDLVERAFPR